MLWGHKLMNKPSDGSPKDLSELIVFYHGYTVGEQSNMVSYNKNPLYGTHLLHYR